MRVEIETVTEEQRELLQAFVEMLGRSRRGRLTSRTRVRSSATLPSGSEARSMTIIVVNTLLFISLGVLSLSLGRRAEDSKWLLMLQINRKTCFLRVVSERIWAEVAVWSTRKSALKGWSFQRKTVKPFGRRLITPLIGVAVCFSLEPRNDQGRSYQQRVDVGR
jgi:hypothetical protein